MTAWSVARHLDPADGVARLAALTADGTLRALPDELRDATLDTLLATWADGPGPLAGWSPADGAPLAAGPLLAPFERPGTVLCAGANYACHLEEVGLAPVDGARPFFFVKPASAIAGPAQPIAIPTAPEARVDWEAELGVVIGRDCRDVDPAQALDHVAGYLVLNDVSARGLLAREDGVVPAMNFDWLASKGRDGFCPIGPGLTPAWLVPDPQALRITCRVNGELRQDASTAGMTFTVAELIAEASRLTTLRPGDLVATGTPAGVAMASGAFLRPGDTVETSIDGLGTLTNPIVAAGAPA